MAEQGGVDPVVLRAIVARDSSAMPVEVALVVRFTEATLRHAREADELREDVVRRLGKRGLIALAFTMLQARMYPTLKYALGHGHACQTAAASAQRPSTDPRRGPDRAVFCRCSAQEFSAGYRCGTTCHGQRTAGVRAARG